MEEPQSARGAVTAFLKSCGVTARVMETPQNRFAELDVLVPADAPRAVLPAGHPRRPVPAPPAAPSAPPGAGGEADAAPVDAAREAARAASCLAELRQALARFEGCPLKATARSTCFGEGPENAAIMFVGEAPGREEDEAGRPFVGRSGQLLEKMVAAIGLARSQVFISNVIPWRPPANRTPSPIETAACEVFVRQEIRLVRPKVLVPLGGTAAKTLLRIDAGIMRQRGRWTRYAPDETRPDETIPAMATFHPAYLLRTPAEKRRVWQDLLSIAQRLEETASRPAGR